MRLFRIWVILKVDGTNTFLKFTLLAKNDARARGVSRSRETKTGWGEASLLKWLVHSFSAADVMSLFVYDETYFPPW